MTVPFLLDVAAALPKATVLIPSGAIRLNVTSQGFQPARVEARPGRELTLAITRDNSPNCGSRILFPDSRSPPTLSPVRPPS